MRPFFKTLGEQLRRAMTVRRDLYVTSLIQSPPLTCPICGKGPYKYKGWAKRHYQTTNHAYWEKG